MNFLKVYFSPFKFIFPKFYIGKIKIGVPYFLPRKFIKVSNTNKLQYVSKKCGFDFVDLGYKIKWNDLDYRFEYNPIWSFVLFKLQIAIIFEPIHEHHYWTCWLIYNYHTDKSKTKKQRIIQAKKLFPCIWYSYKNDIKETICYWDLILKEKYIK